MSSTPQQFRPNGLLDPQGRVIEKSHEQEAFQGDYLSGVNLIYAGFAKPGASTASQVWRIFMCTYDGNNNILTITWPQNAFGHASKDYEFIWADRASYTYS